MAKMDSFLNRLDDIMYEVWKLKNDIERYNTSYGMRAKATAKLEECFRTLNDVELIFFRYERETTNDE